MRLPIDRTGRIGRVVDRRALRGLPGLFRIRAGDAAHQARGKRLLQVLLLVAAAGAGAALTSLFEGHAVMGTTSAVPWGVLIATYVYFVAFASGLCLVGSLGHVFGFARFEPIAKKALFLALVTLVVGFSVIASELERPLLLARMVVLSPNPASPIWWMGTLYFVYLLVIAAELLFLFNHDHARAKVAGIAGIVAAVAAHSNLGAVFGLARARSFWSGAFTPLYLVALALLSGAALLVLAVYLEDYFTNDRALGRENAALLSALRKLLALFIAIVLLFDVWRMVAGLAGGHGRAEVTGAMVAGPLFVSFWLFEILLGLVVPLGVLLSREAERPRNVAFAAALAVGCLFVARFNFVYAGQMLPQRPLAAHLGEALHYGPPFKGHGAGFLPYTPSLVEVLIVAGAVAAATLLYTGGCRVLKLGKDA